MRRCVGVLAEAYSKWERRAPLTPAHVAKLVRDGIEVRVTPSTKRVFTNAEYVEAGAMVTNDLSPANAILGVKQPANGSLLPDKTYLFFSHVIKAQPENMALLDEILEKKVRLIDYECIRKDGGGSTPRLVAFGTFAGKAGIIDGLRGLGLRLLGLGHSSPFLALGTAGTYADYADARRAIGAVGAQIAKHGVPAPFSPLVFGIAGTGNVSRGAIDALGALGTPTAQSLPTVAAAAARALRACAVPARSSRALSCTRLRFVDPACRGGGGRVGGRQRAAQTLITGWHRWEPRAQGLRVCARHGALCRPRGRLGEWRRLRPRALLRPPGGLLTHLPLDDRPSPLRPGHHHVGARPCCECDRPLL